ncbi:hypothetical protein GOZ89_18310 [Agrobacterium vitis]|nr:hypothetical protein [Agrobacterium vitis]MUO71677.1 hypothetical protein [Agrobacterium vitis]MUO86245.1 hypothetical protein [Agrobacterium vitis]MVA36772.1 hypothetical protein [Agrobacterium vitis]MVA81378.1 hypothetical protein [Agrobacterium vitis]
MKDVSKHVVGDIGHADFHLGAADADGSDEELFPTMVITTSSTYRLSPSVPADSLRVSLAKCLPNFSAHSLTVWCETLMPCAASKSSTTAG